MHCTYLNLPPVPQDIERQILHIVNNPTLNAHDSDAFIENMKDARHELNIDASQEIIDAIKNVEYNAEDSLGYPLSEAWLHFKNLAYFDFLEVNSELNQWVRAEIDKDVSYVSIQCMHSGTTITPHIDEMRRYAVNYVISTGGNSVTSFYKPKLEFEHLHVYPQTVFPFDRLDKIKEIQIEPHRWHRLDTSVIHSVENIDPTLKRISLSLSYL